MWASSFWMPFCSSLKRCKMTAQYCSIAVTFCSDCLTRASKSQILAVFVLPCVCMPCTQLLTVAILPVTSVIAFQMSLYPCTILVLASLNHATGSGISGIPQSSFCCAIAPLRSGSVCSRRSAAIARSRLSSFIVEGWCSVDSV